VGWVGSEEGKREERKWEEWGVKREEMREE
jgi:hypothetical protein